MIRKFRSAGASILAALRVSIGPEEILVGLGLGLLGGGLWAIYPPAAAIAVGGVLLSLGLVLLAGFAAGGGREET